MVYRCEYSPSGSLHFKGTLLPGYASLTGASLPGKFFMEWSWFGYISVCLIFWSELDFPMQCHWLASWLPMGLAFSTLLLCFMSASPNLSTHAYITSCTIFLFFFFFNLPSLKQIFRKKKKTTLRPSSVWKLIRQIKISLYNFYS